MVDKSALNDHFLIACENGDIDLARQALENGAESDCYNSVHESAVHLAVKSGSEKMVQYLTHELRLNPDSRDSFGRTPLHWAAQQGNVPVAEALLMAHARISAKDDNGVEPKIYAELAGHNVLVRMLSSIRRQS